MEATIHALFIAIDDYPIAHHRLNGCVNDAECVITYLENNYPCEQLNIKRVFDKDATKAGVIASFAHFKAAQPNDVCLLYYTGHGSQAAAPKEFLHLDPDGKLETMVCWDSRLQGGRDLMDKELSYLIWEVTHEKDVQFTAIFDCCHSGTNTRAVGVASRQIKKPHPLPSFVKDFHGHEHYTVNSTGTTVTPPSGRHVHLAAADAKQTAKELKINGTTRGAFTYNLIQLLEQHNGQLSYREVIEHLDVRIGKLVSDQTPQLSSNESEDKNRWFLGEAPEKSATNYAVNFDPDLGRWFVNAGELHGIPTRRLDQMIWAVTHDGQVSTVPTSSVTMDRSYLSGLDNLATDKSYLATVDRLPVAPVRLALVDGDEREGQAIISEKIKDRPSPFYSLVNQGEEADYWIRAIDNSLRLTLPGEDRPIFRRVHEYTNASATIFLTDTEAVAKFEHIRDIQNPMTTLGRNDFEIELYRISQPGAWRNDDECPAELVDWREEQVFRYDYDSSKQGKKRWQEPAFRMKVRNTSDRNLYFSAVNMGADYGITNKFLEGRELAPGQEVWLLDRVKSGKTFKCIPMKVKDGFLAYGVNEITEYLKLFVSTKKIDTNSFNQAALKLDNPEIEARTRAGRDEADYPPQDDWMVADLILKAVRPSQEVALTNGGKGTVGRAVEIEVPAGVSCIATLNGKAETTRNLSRHAKIPPVPSGWELHALDEGLTNKPAVNVLELYQMEGSENINADQPIKVRMEYMPAPEETLIPVAFDPESGLYFPVGIMDEDGTVMIEELPMPTTSGTRSLGGSIKIFFQKTVSKYLPFVYKHPQLAIGTLEEVEQGSAEADVAPAGLKINYNTEAAAVKAAVSSASNIALFIHGIIGDTTEMPKSMRLVQNEAGDLLEGNYDLVLTFDYENLNTEIQQTAKDLKQRLADAGLSAGHDKNFHIIAHSMGGLVSRWFIEKEGGNEIVSRLFQLGTPNQGSPYGTLYEMATPLLANAVNGAAFLQPYALALRAVGKFLDKLFVTLKQMNSDSDFMKALNDGTDPGIPYTIIAGNTQLIPSEIQEKQLSMLRKVMKRFKSRGHYDALDKLLFKSPNDIAVSVESISEIPGSDKWSQPPRVLPSACDHISYFGDPAGLESMAKALL